MGTSLKKVAKKTKEYKYVLLAMRHAKPSRSAATAATWDVSSPTKDVSRPKPWPKDWRRSKWCPLVSHAPAPPAPVRPAIACSRCSATIRKSTTGKACTKAACNPVFDELAQTKEKHHTLLVLGHEPTISIACQWLASTESDPTLLDLLNLGMSPASIAVFGSNEPFNQWQLHSGELIALLTAKDFE